ncbi:MAG: hypothetical protein LBD11_02160 [Candidatus Peribacteria bacterium]|nr:hypothetical protein [Candidatus Peribacteria bacterium]
MIKDDEQKETTNRRPELYPDAQKTFEKEVVNLHDKIAGEESQKADDDLSNQLNALENLA